MPIDMQYDDDGFVIIQVLGDPSLDEHLAFADRIANDEIYARHPRLWDYRGCTRELSARDLERHALHVRRIFGGTRSRAAFLVGHDVQFGNQRMFQALRGVDAPGFQRKVFRDEAEAKRWLLEGDDSVGETVSGDDQPNLEAGR